MKVHVCVCSYFIISPTSVSFSPPLDTHISELITCSSLGLGHPIYPDFQKMFYAGTLPTLDFSS